MPKSYGHSTFNFFFFVFVLVVVVDIVDVAVVLFINAYNYVVLFTNTFSAEIDAYIKCFLHNIAHMIDCM